MGNTQSKRSRCFSIKFKHSSIRKKATLIFDGKPNNKASIHTENESKNLTDLHKDPRVGSSLPPTPISIPKVTDTNSNEQPKPLIVNDRIYQNTKKYMLPIDDQEQDKLIQEVKLQVHISFEFSN